MAERSIASARQYIYKRNFNENVWQDVGSGACKINVKKKGNNFTLQIRPPGDSEVKIGLHRHCQDGSCTYMKCFSQICSVHGAIFGSIHTKGIIGHLSQIPFPFE